jgi:plastocyanin
MASTRVRTNGRLGTAVMQRAVVAVIGGALLLIAGATPGAQQGGAVRGKVAIGIPVTAKRPTSAAYPGRTVPTATLAPVSELRNVVVFLEDAPARPQPPVHVEIRQRDETFVPRVVAVPVGSTVDFPNDDPIYHNVFSLSSAKNFNLGRYPKGKSKPVTFDKPGLVRVFCDIHSHMSATVFVFNHPWFAVPDEDGHFQLPAVPPGDREITAWHERLGDTTLPVRVDSGRPATVDFVLPVPAK